MPRLRVARPVRLAVILWIAWAVVVWNVVFDRVLVLAGRSYVYAASVAADGGGPYLRIEDWMRPAVTHGFWLATTTGGMLLALGLALIALAAKRDAQTFKTSSGRAVSA